MSVEAVMRSMRRFAVGVWVGCVVVLGGTAPAAGSGDGRAPPPPPYDAPAAVVNLSWDHQADLILLYDATTSTDPLGSPAAGAFAAWAGGCMTGALTGDEVLPLFLGGGSRAADEGAYNWADPPGTYSIRASSKGYCVNPGADGSERARAMYEALPPGSTFTVQARVELYAAGATTPEVQTLTMAVPVQLAAETATVIGTVTVAAPVVAEGSVTSESVAPATTPTPTAATGDATAASEPPTGGLQADNDGGTIRWLVDPMVWLAAALVFGLATLVFIVRTVLKGLRPWDATHVVPGGTPVSEIGPPARGEDAMLVRAGAPSDDAGGTVVSDRSVRVVQTVAGTDDVVIEFRNGTRARVSRQAIAPREQETSTFRPSHHLSGTVAGWDAASAPGVGEPDLLPTGHDQLVEVVRSSGGYTLVRYGWRGRYRMWVPSDALQVRGRRRTPESAATGPTH